MKLHQRKAIFSIKNIYLYSLCYLAALITFNTHVRVILAVSCSEDIIFLETLLL